MSFSPCDDLPFNVGPLVWYDDGNLTLKVGEVRLRVHGSLLASQSPFWATWLDKNAQGDDVTARIHSLKPRQVIMLMSIVCGTNDALIRSSALDGSACASLLDAASALHFTSIQAALSDRLRRTFPHDLSLLPEGRQDYGIRCDWGCEWAMLRSVKAAKIWSVVPALYYRIVTTYSGRWLSSCQEDNRKERIILLVAQQQLGVLQRLHTWGWLFDSYTCDDSPDCKDLKSQIRADFFSARCEQWNIGVRALEPWQSEWDTTLCQTCLRYGKRKHAEGRVFIWNLLPKLFGLGSWADVFDMESQVLAEVLQECEGKEYWRGRSDPHGIFAASMHNEAASGMSDTEAERITCAVLWSYGLLDVAASMGKSSDGPERIVYMSSYGGMASAIPPALNPDITLNDLGAWAKKVQQLIGFDFLTDQSLIPKPRGTTDPALYLLTQLSRYESQRQSLTLLSNLLSAAFHYAVGRQVKTNLVVGALSHSPFHRRLCDVAVRFCQVVQFTPDEKPTSTDEDDEKKLDEVKRVILPDGDTGKLQKALAVAITCSPILLASERSYKRAPNNKEMIATWRNVREGKKPQNVIVAEAFVWECVFDLAESLDIASCLNSLLAKVNMFAPAAPVVWIERLAHTLVSSDERQNVSRSRLESHEDYQSSARHEQGEHVSMVQQNGMSAAPSLHCHSFDLDREHSDRWADFGTSDFSQLSPFCTPTTTASLAVSLQSAPVSRSTSFGSGDSVWTQSGSEHREATIDPQILSSAEWNQVDQWLASSMGWPMTSDGPCADWGVTADGVPNDPTATGKKDTTNNKRNADGTKSEPAKKRKKPRVLRLSDEEALKEALSRKEFRLEHVVEVKSELDFVINAPLLDMAPATPMIYAGEKVSFYCTVTRDDYEWFPLFMHDDQLQFFQRLLPSCLQKHKLGEEDAWVTVHDVSEVSSWNAERCQQAFANGNLLLTDGKRSTGGFCLETIRKLGSLEAWIDIEDQSVLDKTQRRTRGTPIDLWRNSQEDYPKPLQGGRMPSMYDPFLSYAVPIEHFFSENWAWEEVKGMEFCPRRETFPVSERRWGQCITAGVLQPWTVEPSGLATIISLEVGALLFFLLQPIRVDAHAMTTANQLNEMGVDMTKYRVEAVILTPGVSLFLRPNQIHCYAAIENSIAYGGHFYATSTLCQSLAAIVGEFIMDGNTYNPGTTTAILTHLMTLFHRNLTLPLPRGAPERSMAHIPDPKQWEGLQALTSLCAYFELSSAWEAWTYKATPDMKDWLRAMNNRRLARELMGWVFQNHRCTSLETRVLSATEARQEIYYKTVAATVHTAVSLLETRHVGDEALTIGVGTHDVKVAFEACLRNSPMWDVYRSLNSPSPALLTLEVPYSIEAMHFSPIDMTVVDHGSNERDRLFARRFKTRAKDLVTSTRRVE
ncbi:hypothetical protein H0H93_006177 [Arthromyces matolae]|nr:hypothetical protein H0H93_006177 [Arthromyces matolae]